MVSVSGRQKKWIIAVAMLLFLITLASVVFTTTVIYPNRITGGDIVPLSKDSFAIFRLGDQVSPGFVHFGVYNISGATILSTINLTSSANLYGTRGSSAAAIALNSTMVVGAYYNATNYDYYFHVLNVDGTDTIGGVRIAEGTSNSYGISMAAINETAFIITYLSTGATDDVVFISYNTAGNNLTGVTTVKQGVGISYAVDIAMFNSTRLTLTWFDDTDNNVIFKNYDLSSGLNTTGEIVLSTGTGNSRAVSVSTINETAVAYAWYDYTDTQVETATYLSDGTKIAGPTVVSDVYFTSYNVVKTAKVTNTTYAVDWYDPQPTGGSGKNITFKLYDVNGTQTKDNTNVIRPGALFYTTIGSSTLVPDIGFCGDGFIILAMNATLTTFEFYNSDGTIGTGICPTAPTLTIPSISPIPAYFDSELTVNTTYSDLNNNNGDITFIWHVNGTNVFTESFINQVTGIQLNSTLGSGNFSRFNLINVSVNATDSTGLSSSLVWSTQLNISNKPPSFDETFSDVLTYHNLNITIQLNATDGDGDSLTWADNTTLFDINSTGYIEDNPTQAQTGNYSIRINITDGFNTTNMDFTYEIVNRLATVPSLTAEGDTHSSNQTTLEWSVSTDADGDSIVYDIRIGTSDTATDKGSWGGVAGTSQISTANLDEWDTVFYWSARSYDGLGYSAWATSDTFSRTNEPPSLTVNITSNDDGQNKTNSTLTLSYNCSDSDSDTCDNYKSYKWFKEGTIIAGQTTTTLSGGNFSKNDNITAEITIEDDSTAPDNQTITNTTTIQIQNTNPVSNFTTSLTPATTYTNETLTITNTSAVYDLDGDTITLTYKWFNDSGVIVGETTTALDSTHFVKHDNITVEIIATDTSGAIAQINTSRTISNSVPLGNFTTSLTPATAYSYSNLTITNTSGVYDEDGDTITLTYKWFNDSGVIAGETTTGLGAGNFSNYENMTAEITASDSDDTVAVNTTRTISNTLPTIASAVITPDPATISQNLTCNNGSVSDLDGDSLTLEYTWYNDTIITTLTTQVIGAGNTSAGEQWYCMINVTDGVDYSGAVTSQTLVIDSLQTAPTINYTNATTATVQITSDAINPTQNNSWINLSVTFADANSGENHTAYFCKTNSFDGECTGSTFCVSAINSSSTPTLTCRYNLSSETINSISYYVYVIDNQSLHQGSGSGTANSFIVNYPPTMPTITVPLNNSWVITNSSTLQFSSTDSDGDTITYLIYGTENATPSTLINSTQSTYNWTGLNETYYYFKVRANDSHGYLTDINSTTIKFGVDYTAPTISNDSLSTTSFYTDETVTIALICSDSFSGMNTTETQFNITDVLLALSTHDMTYMSANNYNDVYVPLGVAGNYNLSTFWCSDQAGNKAELSSVLAFSTTIRPASGSSSAGGSSTIIQSVQLLNYSVCGNGICEEGESPATCPADCKINFDRMIKCIWDDEIDCMYTDTWFVTIIFVILVGSGVLLAYAGESNNVKKRRKRN